MAVTVDPKGNKAPAGGFQNGGWYSGYQYFNGSFASQAGVIHPESSQQGAGQAVSKEVNQQSSVAQGKAPTAIDTYVAKQNATPNVAAAPTVPTSGFTDKSQVQSYTNSVQNGLYGASTDGVPAVRSVADIATEIKGALPTDSPTAPKMADVYAEQRKALGVDGLEGTVADLTKTARDLEAEQRKRIAAETGKSVPLNVISGRVTEVQRQEAEKLDMVNREKAYAIDQLNSAYKNIDLIMQFTQTDYSNAKSAYDSKFAQTMQILTMARGVQQDEITAQNRAQDTARANAQIMMNSLKDGGIDYNSMAPEMKAQLNKLELQAGLPIGFFGSIKKDPKADIISTTESGGQFQVLLRNPDGSMGIQTYGTKTTGGGTVTERNEQRKRDAFSEMNDILSRLGGNDKIVSGSQWKNAKSDWVQQGYDEKDFIAAFSKFTNSEWDRYEGL